MNPKLNRRQFMGSTLGTMAYLAAMASPLGLLRKVGAAATTKRYLVNIQGMGGWDTHWFHHAFPSTHAQFPATSTDPNILPNTQIIGGTEGVRENFFHMRTPDSDLMVHPNRPDVYLGKAMKYVFGTNSDLIANDMLIWRGIPITDAHGVGNHIIQGGGVSSYALSFAALIAQGIATNDYQRPLHYVQLTSTPDAFNSTFAMNVGAEVPVNLPDYSSFNSLTAPNSNDFSASSQRDLINNAVANLSAISSNRLKMKTSQQVYTSFMNGFNSAAGLSSTNLAQSNRFYYLWRTYADAMCTNVYNMYNSGASDFNYNLLPIVGPDGSDISAVNLFAVTAKSDLDNLHSAGYDWTSSSPFSSYADALSKEGQTFPWVTTFVNFYGQGYGWWTTIAGAAFNYAMAEFMIREDLAAVIDVPTPTSDAHDLTNDHLVRLIATFTAYKTLLSRLKADGLLAQTTVALWSELDRTPNWIFNTDSYNRGTGHNTTTSVLLAGYGIQGGKVVGDVMTGPGGNYNWRQNNGIWTHDFPNAAYSSGLPIDQNTGLVSNASNAVTNLHTRFVLPTMLSIFGLQVPPEQITDGFALPCIVKAS